MDLPQVKRTYSDVSVIGFYHRAALNVSQDDGNTIVYTDRTEYTAYAERCCDSTVTKPASTLTKEFLAAMHFREFAETITHQWIADRRAAPVEIGSQTRRKFKTRDSTSGHWLLTLRRIRRHIRFSTVLYTEPAHLYQPLDPEDTTTQTSFFSLPAEKRKQLYRSYMELVCYVPWIETPESTFLSDDQRKALADELRDTEHDDRYNLRRLEMFFQVYLQKWNNGDIAPPGSVWHRDNSYSFSQFLNNDHNSEIHRQRVVNKGVLKAHFETADELDGTSVDIQAAITDQFDDSEFPSALNFLPSDTFREVMDQPPPTIDEVSVAFPLQPDYQRLEELIMLDKTKLFMARPPAPSIAFADLTPIQRWAVEVCVDKAQQIIYVCGPAGSGKSLIVLHVCERMKREGRDVQASAPTGKAASNFHGPTVHGMFGWAFDAYSNGRQINISQRKIGELRAFYDSTDLFVIDEVNAMSAESLAQVDECMTSIFNPTLKKVGGELLPFGGKKMLFLGDPAQLKPVAGEPIYTQGTCTAQQAARRHGARGVRQTRFHRTSRGQELYRKYLQPNCIFLRQGKRNSGLLQQICDRLRYNEQTSEDLEKLTYQRRKFPTFLTDYGIYYDNESCALHNWQHAWFDCKTSKPQKRLYICKASYSMTSNNQPVIDALSSLPSTKFGYAADVICLSIGSDVRLIKNVNVSAGLVNSAIGKVVKVIYNNADVPALLQQKNPPPYMIIVDFPGFQVLDYKFTFLIVSNYIDPCTVK